jgi:hypothetical protein
MKKLILVLIIGLFTISINARQTQLNLDYLKNAKKKVGAGIALITVGAGTTVVGGVKYFKGLNGIWDNSSGTEIDSISDNAYLGLAIMVVGGILTDIGIPYLIVGSIQKHRAERNLQFSMVQFKSPNNHTSINGIGLTIRF